jgi:tetraacyldisaccharide 4'-kinase
MKLKKPQFWDYKKPNIIAYFLWPISITLQLLNSFKKIFISKKKFKNIKTICIGNIYIGGTGKTSLSLKVYEILSQKKFKTCFIKKDYIDQLDEQKILEKKGKLFKSKKRLFALKNALSENYEVAIFDDGFQDETINYDLKFVCFNNLNWIGNGLTIPSGPLRENFRNIKNCNHIFINGDLENIDNIKKKILETNPKVNIHIGKYVPENLEKFNINEKYLVFSGIGNHKTFLSMLKKNNFNIIKDIEFPDHYKYSKKDIDKIISISKNYNCKILTTEKDFFRSKNYMPDKIEFISSKLEVLNEKKLFEALTKIYEQN